MDVRGYVESNAREVLITKEGGSGPEADLWAELAAADLG